MIVGFTGSREGMTSAQHEAVRAILSALRPGDVHHGDCVGADNDLHEICVELGLWITIHPPDVERHRAHCGGVWVSVTHPPLPYRKRNLAIVDACDLLIACPSGNESADSQRRSGTWMTVRMARKTGKSVHIVYPNGLVIPE